MIKKLFFYLANLKLAIIILLTVALFSSFGSIIEQNKDVQFYEKHYSFSVLGIPFSKIITTLELNNVYSNWWFLTLLIILGISLSSCTLVQQLPTLKFSQRYYFYKQLNQYNKFFFKIKSNKVCKSQLTFNLLNQHYSLFYQKNCIYGYKGLISRVGPIIVHLSLICILFGSTLSALQGFTSQELIPKSEIFHIQNIIKTGALAQIPQKSFRINDFWSIYTKKGDVTQFYSDISILNSQANEIKRKTISVNNPLLFNDLLLYQTDWGILGFRLELKNQSTLFRESILQIPVLKINTVTPKIFISSLPFVQENQKVYILSLRNNRGQVSIYNNKGEFIKTLNLGETSLIENLPKFNFIEIISSTGIQIKSDPGIKIIYIGFLILMFSSLISYLSFSEFWLLDTSEKAIAGARTNRSKVKLNIEFLKLQQFFID